MPPVLFEEAFLRKLERLALLSRRAAAGQLQGERRSARRGQSVEFADYRQYVLGDDFRRIDWNAYARLERFFIKLFVEERELTLHLLLDNSPSMDWGEPNKLDLARRAAGALGYVALLGLDRVALSPVGANSGKNHLVQTVRGKKQAPQLFQNLLNLQPAIINSAASRSIAYQLGAYAANAVAPGPLVLFTDLMDDGWRAGVNALAGRGFEITLVHLLSPDEIDPQLSGDFKLIDREHGGAVEISADYQTLQRYKQSLRAWQDEWRRYCLARKITYLPISSDLSLDDLLFDWLRRSGVLR